MDLNPEDEVSDVRRDSRRSLRATRGSVGTSMRTSRFLQIQVPNEDNRKSLSRFTQRTASEHRIDYRFESMINPPIEYMRYKPNDTADLMSRQPSYRKFKIPYQMICGNRYRESIKAYEAQLVHEVRNNIDFQRTAADACYFVRCMAITSFWPPLHNMKEVRHTSKNFFQLSPKEKWRLQIIMDTDIT
ncbi:uncharacterized protein LOC117790645 [Drosophila innubila]|uniref:uncharacterized protein LOC117790645 n=1 Tax=Drosophila innubila TaxID=198719 RepID=UPI00148D4197|nr:uncharacterized protein LOC117790645 [Drosophila innubila]